MNDSSRSVKFSTKLNILKKKPIPMLFGFLFTLIPLFIILVLYIVFSSIGNDVPVVDFDLINRKGKETSAVITNIETQYNIRINGIHPTIMSYKYSDQNKIHNFKYKTLSERKAEQLQIGDKITIKELQGSSIIPHLQPYKFSIGFFFLIPIPFLLIGLPFLFYAVISFRKELKLYKYGKVIKAKIISMIAKTGVRGSNMGQGIVIHYAYESIEGKKLGGESLITDYCVGDEKKKDDYISIFVLPENEEKSCIVPKLESLRNNWNIE